MVATNHVAISSAIAVTPALVRRLIRCPPRADAQKRVRSRGGSWGHPLKPYQREGLNGRFGSGGTAVVAPVRAGRADGDAGAPVTHGTWPGQRARRVVALDRGGEPLLGRLGPTVGLVP